MHVICGFHQISPLARVPSQAGKLLSTLCAASPKLEPRNVIAPRAVLLQSRQRFCMLSEAFFDRPVFPLIGCNIFFMFCMYSGLLLTPRIHSCQAWIDVGLEPSKFQDSNPLATCAVRQHSPFNCASETTSIRELSVKKCPPTLDPRTTSAIERKWLRLPVLVSAIPRSVSPGRRMSRTRIPGTIDSHNLLHPLSVASCTITALTSIHPAQHFRIRIPS